MERDAEALFAEIERQGGVVTALQAGWFQRCISESAGRQQWEQEQRRRLTVGVNVFTTDGEEAAIPLLRVGEETTAEQRIRLAELRGRRDGAAGAGALRRMQETAGSGRNVFPAILDAARAYCTLYEIRAAMESVFGAYREPVFF